MELVAIGKVVDKNKKVIGARIYNCETGNMKDTYFESIKNAILNGVKILGIKINDRGSACFIADSHSVIYQTGAVLVNGVTVIKKEIGSVYKVVTASGAVMNISETDLVNSGLKISNMRLVGGKLEDIDGIDIPKDVKMSLQNNVLGSMSLFGIVKPYEVSDGVLTKMKDRGYAGSVDITNGIRGIARGAFYKCINVENVYMPDTLIDIGVEAFSYCGVKGVEFGENVAIIGDRAFEGCKNLETVILPQSLQKMGIGVFGGCKKLRTVKIPINLVRTVSTRNIGNSRTKIVIL